MVKRFDSIGFGAEVAITFPQGSRFQRAACWRQSRNIHSGFSQFGRFLPRLVKPTPPLIEQYRIGFETHVDLGSVRRPDAKVGSRSEEENRRSGIMFRYCHQTLGRPTGFVFHGQNSELHTGLFRSFARFLGEIKQIRQITLTRRTTSEYRNDDPGFDLWLRTEELDEQSCSMTVNRTGDANESSCVLDYLREAVLGKPLRLRW